MRRFEFVDGSSQKFWEIALRGAEFDVRWGRIGTSGQAQTKRFASDAKARAEHDKLVKEKAGKGYVEVASSPVSPRSPAPSAPAKVEAASRADSPVSMGAPRMVATDPRTWPSAWSRYVVPRPAWASSAPDVDAEALWKRLRSWAARYDGTTVEPALVASVRARFQSEEVQPPASPALESGVYWVCKFQGMAADVIDHWVSTGGPEHALRVVATIFDRDHDRTYGNEYEAWMRLAAHLAPLPLEERMRIAQAVPTQYLGALLFHETGDADRAVQGGAVDPRLLAGIADPQTLPKLGALQSLHGLKLGYGWNNQSLLPLLLTWTATFGEALVPTLAQMLAGATSDTAIEREFAQTLALIASPQAVELLAARADERAFVGPLRDAALRAPDAAIPVLAARATQRGAVAMPCRVILAQVLEGAEASHEAVIAALPPASLKLVTELRAAASVVIDEASDAELPSWLVTPPWETKQAAAAAGALHLRELAHETELHWPTGLRERWAALDRAPGKMNFSQHWGISEELAKRLIARDDPADEAEAKKAIAQLPTHQVVWEENLVGLDPKLAKKLMKLHAHRAWPGNLFFFKTFAREGLDVLDVVLSYAKHHPREGLEVLLPVGLPSLAMAAAELLLKAKRDPAYTAIAWLKQHPEAASIGLIPSAVGKPGKARDAAEKAMRLLVAEGHEATLMAVAARYGEAALGAVKGMLNANPLAELPAKIPTLPDFLRLASLPRLTLTQSGKALPERAMVQALTMLAISTLDAPYAGVRMLQEITTPASRAALAWALFQAWLIAGAPSKESWCFAAMGPFSCSRLAR